MLENSNGEIEGHVFVTHMFREHNVSLFSWTAWLVR